MAKEDNMTAPEPQTEENEKQSNLTDGVKKKYFVKSHRVTTVRHPDNPRRRDELPGSRLPIYY